MKRERSKEKVIIKMKGERNEGYMRMGIPSYSQICTRGAQTLAKKVEDFKISLEVVLENVHAEQFCSSSRGDGLDVNLLVLFHLQFL